MTTSVVRGSRRGPGRRDRIASVVVDRVVELAPERVGDEDDGNVERFGVLEQHAHVRLEPAVREDDDRVVGCEGEELVGERRSGVHERAAGLPDALRDELPVGGEVRRRSDASPDDSVAAGEDRDGVLEGLRTRRCGSGVSSAARWLRIAEARSSSPGVCSSVRRSRSPSGGLSP